MDNIKYAIEGILFAAGEPVKAAKLAVVLDTSVDEVNKAVDELKKELIFLRVIKFVQDLNIIPIYRKY